MSKTKEKDESTQKWEVHSLADAPNHESNPDLEEEYRRGYHDGFYKGMEAMSDYLGVDIPDELWRFWHTGELSKWRYTVVRFEFPPAAPKSRRR